MVPGVGKADGPTAEFLGRITQAENTATGRGDERVANTPRSEDSDHAIDGVALAYSAGIDLDPGPIEAHGPIYSVELYVPISHQFERIMNLVGRWDVTASSPKAPGSHQGADGHIERAFTGSAVLNAVGEETEQLWRDCKRTRCGVAIDTAPLGLWSVVRQQGVQAVRFLKGSVDRFVHGRMIGSIEDDSECRPHGIRSSFQPLRRGCSRQRNGCHQSEKENLQDCCFGI